MLRGEKNPVSHLKMCVHAAPLLLSIRGRQTLQEHFQTQMEPNEIFLDMYDRVIKSGMYL